MKQKYSLFTILTFIAGSFLVASLSHGASSDKTEADWMLDYDAALKKAEESGKPLLVYFTGSGWCPACVALDKEVLSKKPFIEYANQNLIMLKADFSPYGQPTSKKYAKQHNRLAYTFDIEGFPSIVLLSPKGDFLEKFFAYREGGPEKYVQYLSKLLAKM